MASEHYESGQNLISNQGFEDATIAQLRLSRLYFMDYSIGAIPDCSMACEKCNRDHGFCQSTECAIYLLYVVDAMRMSRRTTFRFNNPNCKKCKDCISECERLLFSTIESCRNGNRQLANVTAMMLCEGHDTTGLFKAIDRLNRHVARRRSLN